MRRGSLVSVVLMLLATCLFGIDLMPSARAGTLYVGGAGPGNYTTIQKAIDASAVGDVVYVYNGTYRENIHIGKEITLVGQDRYGTIIDGGGSGDVIRVKGEDVFIESFTVRNSGYGNAGISFDQNWGVASRIIITNNYIGARVSPGASGAVDHSEFRDLTSSAVDGYEANVGVGSSLLVNGWVGFGGLSTGSVSGNLFLGGGINIGGMDGWAPCYCGVGGNYMVDGSGISLSYTWDCSVWGNTLVSNGVSLTLTSGTSVTRNNFVDGGAYDFNNDGHTNRTNWWDDGSKGNYWSDYTGVDVDGDGIGDTPYVIDEDSQDNYPLMDFIMRGPSGPRDLKAWTGVQRVTLAWREPLLDGGSPVTNYSVYRMTAGQSYSLVAELGNVKRFTDFPVAPGETYYYYVSAKNAVREGGKSDSVKVQVPPDVLTPKDWAQNPFVGRISLNSTPPVPPIPGSGFKVTLEDDEAGDMSLPTSPQVGASGLRHRRESRCT